MSNPVTDYPDWQRAIVVFPAQTAPGQPPIAPDDGTGTLGAGNVGIGANWQLVISGTLKIVRFTISNPHHSDGNQAHATTTPQDPIWVQYVNVTDPAPDNGVTGGIYLPSPGFLYEDAWFGDVYASKAGEIAGVPTVSFQLIVSTV